MGRTFTRKEDRLGGNPVVMLSYGFWQRKLANAQNGKCITLSGKPYTIIGVLPKDMALPLEEADVWSLVRVVLPDASAARGVHFRRTYCLLKPGLHLSQAQAQMKVLDSHLEKIDPFKIKIAKHCSFHCRSKSSETFDQLC